MFDGYLQKPTTKYHTHTERTQTTGIGPEVYLSAIMKLAFKIDRQVSEQIKKQTIINLFSDMTIADFRVIHAPDDVDTLIA